MGFPDSEDGLPSSTADWVLQSATDISASANNTHKYSMHVDAENDRPIEVEVIFGEVVRMAKERNIEIPVKRIHLSVFCWSLNTCDFKAHRNAVCNASCCTKSDPPENERFKGQLMVEM